MDSGSLNDKDDGEHHFDFVKISIIFEKLSIFSMEQYRFESLPMFNV